MTQPGGCRGRLPARVVEGLAMFNAGQYFEAHEALEEAWRAEPGPLRELYRALLQAAVVYLHMRRGNTAGVLKVHARCRRHLDAWPDSCCGIDIARLRTDLDRAVAGWQAFAAGQVAAMDWSLLAPVEWRES